MKVSNEWNRAELIIALAVWSTPDSEPTIVAAAKEKNIFVSDPAVLLLAKFKSTSAAKAAAAGLTNPHTRDSAATALTAMGQFAEPYVLPFVDSQDFDLKRAAVRILADIGGEKSLTAIRDELSKATYVWTKVELQRAISILESRAKGYSRDSPETRQAAAKAEQERPER